MVGVHQVVILAGRSLILHSLIPYFIVVFHSIFRVLFSSPLLLYEFKYLIFQVIMVQDGQASVSILLSIGVQLYLSENYWPMMPMESMMLRLN